MKRVDEVLLQNIVSLSGDPNFRIFIGWLYDALEEHKDMLIDKPSERTAGAAQELRDIIHTVKESKEMLKSIKSLQDRKPGH